MKIAILLFLGFTTFVVTFATVHICDAIGANRYLALIIGLAFGTATNHILGRYLPIE